MATVDFDSSKLAIESVKINTTAADFIVHEPIPSLGSKISVKLPEDLRAEGSHFNVQINYATDPDASAVQWLEPSATKGGKYPYVFTQSQAIHARSLLPCFDSPGMKSTYTATIKAPTWCTGSPVINAWIVVNNARVISHILSEQAKKRH